MSNKQLSPSAPDVIDSPRKPRPKTAAQIMEMIEMLTYDQQVALFEDFKIQLQVLTQQRIEDTEATAGGLNYLTMV